MSKLFLFKQKLTKQHEAYLLFTVCSYIEEITISVNISFYDQAYCSFRIMIYTTVRFQKSNQPVI